MLRSNSWCSLALKHNYFYYCQSNRIPLQVAFFGVRRRERSTKVDHSVGRITPSIVSVLPSNFSLALFAKY